ncbi:MAG TPA: undecaprenyldiphospho-muramoylpentapeptide beta-N-acetylglucosaminyltransferase [Terriglobales bacterium]|nr:undecaprenyldiphospho-muramoylpentapeptide beta-N-acetylglucosaminyltransferase [Terriglobales bacterium]
MRVVLAGGGTGGHVIPALAIAQKLRSEFGAEVLFIGTARGIETRLVPAAGYELRLVQVGALKNVSAVTRLKTGMALPRAIYDAWKILSEYRANVVIGVGGYASGPAMLAASMSSIPTLAFEPNVVPGFANRVVAPMVSAAAVHFRQTCHYFRRCYVTGVPVRTDFFAIPERPRNAHPTLLVFGGSQGAHAINEVTIASLKGLQEEIPGLLIIHQLGERDYTDAQAAYLRAGVPAEVYPFIENMPEAFSRADLLVCRSGASTVAEVTAAGKPAIFIPFPRAADDHQLRNAEALARAGAALLIPEKELTSERLVKTVGELLRDRARLTQMGRAAKALAHPDAAFEIAALAARLAGVPVSTPPRIVKDPHSPISVMSNQESGVRT